MTASKQSHEGTLFHHDSAWKPYFKLARVLFELHITIGGYVQSGKQVLIYLKFS